MTIYYLYTKTHNKTGLKYLGKTIQTNPHIYRGSGKDWVKHIKKHGYDVTTEILKECSSTKELREWGLYYSTLWNIVESTEWANQIPETGGGAGLKLGSKRSEAAKQKISASSIGKKHSDDSKKKIRESMLGKTRGPYQKRSREHASAISAALKGKSQSEQHCLAKSIAMKESWARRRAAKNN